MLVAVVVLCVGVAVAIVAVLLGAGGDAGPSSPSVAVGAHSGHDMDHGDAVMPGCESVGSTMMMLSPSSADSLVGGPCPWPYDSEIESSGGREDPVITAPFEPRAYQELFDIAAAARLGVCNVGRLPDPAGEGFVFGFTLDVRAGSCADGPATAGIVAREQATRAWRDANAHRAAESSTAPTLVMGRWVIVLTGDATVAAEMAQRLEAAGAAAVPG